MTIFNAQFFSEIKRNWSRHMITDSAIQHLIEGYEAGMVLEKAYHDLRLSIPEAPPMKDSDLFPEENN